MSILIGGDYVPTNSNADLFARGAAEELYGLELNDLLQQAKFTVFNLEAPFAAGERPIKKCGPNLRISPECLKGIQKMGVDMFSLGNNHILDQGSEGLQFTIDALDKKGIGHIGAGCNITEAKKPGFIKIGDITVGIYSCAEHEFSIRKSDEMGANPYVAETVGDDMLNIKKQCDYLIVLYHGGKEYYQYPSPDLQHRCRNMVDRGADLILCQHSHCIGCEEVYNGKKILYGQGNFLFDNSDHPFWQNGLLVSLDEKMEVKYIPVTKNKNKVRLATAEESEKILKKFDERSANIKRPGFVAERYLVFAKEKIDDYIRSFLLPEQSLLFRILCKLTGHKFDSFFINKRLSDKERLSWINFIECEAHRELLLSGLKQSVESWDK